MGSFKNKIRINDSIQWEHVGGGFVYRTRDTQLCFPTDPL